MELICAVKYASGEVHEKVCDKFLTWGWLENQDKAKLENQG